MSWIFHWIPQRSSAYNVCTCTFNIIPMLPQAIQMHGQNPYMDIKFVALCRTIRADCLLMNPHAPTRQMKTGCGGRLISSCLVFKSACWGSLCSEFNASNIVCAIYPLLISILTLWLPIAKIMSFSTQSSMKSFHCTCSTSAYSHTLYRDTSFTHFNRIF